MSAERSKLEDMEIVCHCGGNMEQIRTAWEGIPVRGWKCDACGDELLHPGDAQRALEMVRAIDRGELRVKVRQVGRSLTLTIPKKLAEAYGVAEGEMAEWGVDSEDRFTVRITS